MIAMPRITYGCGQVESHLKLAADGIETKSCMSSSYLHSPTLDNISAIAQVKALMILWYEEHSPGGFTTRLS